METLQLATTKRLQPLSAGRWLVWVAAIIAICAMVLAGIVYAVDPFMYYRTPKSYTYYDARYCLAGVLKHEKYDTVIVGSSMMQNTNPEIVDKAGWNAIKATFSGACPADISMLANYALKYGKPKRIVIAVDCYTYAYAPDFVRTKVPDYLYDDTIWNDGMYWFNNTVWTSIFPGDLIGMYHHKKATPMNMDTNDDWAQQYTFSRAATLKTVQNVDYDKPSTAKSNLNQMEATYNATVYQLAQANPGVEFYLLYPPYSVLAWYGAANMMSLQDDVGLKDYIAQNKLANIRLFEFQDLDNITTNLDNYKDYSHYSPAINDYMMQCLITGENEVKSLTDQQARCGRQIKIASNYKLYRE